MRVSGGGGSWGRQVVTDTILLIVHDDLLQRKNVACFLRPGTVDLTVMTALVSPRPLFATTELRS